MKNTIALSAYLVLFMVAMCAGMEKASADVQKNFNVEKGGKLIVAVGGGDIQVRVWDKMQVQMTARNIGDDADRLKTSQDGNTVRVEYRSDWGWTGSSRDLRFEFYVPKDFNVDLTTSGGDVRIDGALQGDAAMHTSGGDLTLDGVSGGVNGKTSGGDITVRDIEGVADLATAGGDIHVDHAAKDLKISTSGGDISVRTVDENLSATTSGGDMNIAKVGGNLSASTSSGDVTVGNVGGNVSLSTSGGDITLTSGKGKISANTSGGDVSITDVVGSANVSSSGGTVKVGLTPAGGQTSRISSSGGDVYLYLPTDAKVTIKADISGGEDDQIVTDFPITYKSSGDSGSRQVECTLNGGGQEIYLHTSSGNIYIKKSTASTR
ncbi:MAG TPA: DUF4097 family beta strand repeat-containing protein [Candidatus Kryptobacter bacterium]|nr:MAG: hypothetical protein B7Z63_01445 [Ignavibacteriae bacterium 37-53-5]HQT91430.1 DUF4097 family beta strand repeat-containing protein [Candidatus Kryptobacter bacterium]